MTQSNLSRRPVIPPWFWLGLLGLWGIALGLRFWGLERFNTLVFDEIYFAKFGHNYLTQTPFFDAHPPLGKYLIAIGIWLKGYTPWGYRWMNALFGSCIPLILVGIGYQLTRRCSFALLAGTLAVLDGLLLVESRYGLINIYLLTFGLLGQWFVLLSSRKQQGWQHWLWLTLAGLSFGSAAATKWNSLGFLLGIYFCWGLLRLSRWGQGKQRAETREPSLNSLHRLSIFKLFIFIPLVGALLYRLLWIPHLLQNPEFDFVQVHQQMFGYHQRVGSGPNIHPYCSNWMSWPLLLRPVSYFYQRAASLSEPMPMIGPPLPTEKAPYVYSVYATGNPMLWWSTTIAIALVLGLCVWQGELWFNRHIRKTEPATLGLYVQDQPVLIYIATSYIANLLPWLSISRCAFLYHYMPAYLFASLALAWMVESWFKSPWLSLKIVAGTIVLASLVGFFFWLPFYLGLPLSPEAWQLRIWMQSWI
jgi:dolichyl-phosphate-mannose-protein mannosyltransferase